MIGARFLVALVLALSATSSSVSASSDAGLNPYAMQARAHAHAHGMHKRLHRVPRTSAPASSSAAYAAAAKRDAQAAAQASLECWQRAFDAMNSAWQKAVQGGDVTDFGSYAAAHGGLPDPNNCQAVEAQKQQKVKQQAQQKQQQQQKQAQPQQQQQQSQDQPKTQAKPQAKTAKTSNSNKNSNNSNNGNSNNNNSGNNGGGSGSSSGVCGSVNAMPIDQLLSKASSQVQAIGDTIKAAAAAEGVPPQLLIAISNAESTMGEDGAAYSNGGGMFQFTDDGAWAQYGDGKSRMDNGASAWACARYMHDLCNQAGGNLYNALRAYNGPISQGGNPAYQSEIYSFMSGNI